MNFGQGFSKFVLLASLLVSKVMKLQGLKKIPVKTQKPQQFDFILGKFYLKLKLDELKPNPFRHVSYLLLLRELELYADHTKMKFAKKQKQIKDYENFVAICCSKPGVANPNWCLGRIGKYR
jgi:hypothetical protein